MAFKTHFEFEKPLTAKALPLSRAQISRVAARLQVLCRAHAKTRAWVVAMGAPADVWSLLFCDDRQMRSFQKKYRKLDRTTDVLSFPTFEQDELRALFAKLPRGQRSLGDVVLSMPAVFRGAKRGRRSDAQELLEVLIHAYLHLLGFDHVVGGKVRRVDAREMLEFQGELFKKLARQLKL